VPATLPLDKEQTNRAARRDPALLGVEKTSRLVTVGLYLCQKRVVCGRKAPANNPFQGVG